MLTSNDLEFMRQARREIVQGRTTPVILEYEIALGADEWTGETIVKTFEFLAQAVVTEISSSYAIADFTVQEGVTVDKADIWASVALEGLGGFENLKPKKIRYNDEIYVVRSCDRKGIGADVRFEIAARKAAI